LRLVKLAAGDRRQRSGPILRVCHPLSSIIRPVDASGKQGERRSGGSEATGESGRARKRALFGRRHEPKSFLFLIWAGIAVASLGFVFVTAWISLQSRSRTLDAATGSIENLALVLEKLLVRKIDSIETLLHAALHEGRRLQAEPGAQPSTSLLAELAQDVPYVKTVKLIDAADGRILFNLHDTGEAGDGIDLDVDRAYRDEPNLDLYVSRPRRDGPSRRWLTGIARHGAPGTPAARLIVVAHVDIEELQRLFDEINIGASGSIALWRSDGTLLARKPYIFENVGRHMPSPALFSALARSRTGHFETNSVADGVHRIVAYRGIPDKPLIISATLSKDEVLEPWHGDILRNASFVATVILILVAFGGLIARAARRRAVAEAKAQQKSTVLEATLENMDQGLIMFDRDMRVQVCNRRAVELLDLPPALMRSRPRFEDIQRYEFERGEFGKVDQQFGEWLRGQALQRTFHTVERERPNGTVLEIRTAPIDDGGAVRTYTDITARKEVEKHIAHMARHDALTELPNRLLLRERLEEALAARLGPAGETLAVLGLDLDRFKAVNDTLGHPVGDVLLKAVAARIRGCLSEQDTIGRLGGDEFAIIQVGAKQPHGARMLAERLVEAMPEPFSVEGHALNVGVSIGIALAPSDGLDVDTLLKRADLALYRAKAEGRSRFSFFAAGMDTEADARRALETDLRDALAKGEFQLVYQPFMNLAAGEVTGFEALLRWHHPARGAVAPADFIPLAEETGLIIPLGEWILRQACTEAARFPEAIRIAVNVSVVQFRNPHFVPSVVSALAAAGLSPHRLELEITETVLMEESEATLKTLHHLRSLGVRLALDDFGTGYSSLSYLSSFPFDKLKIDRSFVSGLGTNPDCAAIVRAIVGLGTSLGMTITAEGVETPAQLDFIRAVGCSEAQGSIIDASQPIGDAVRTIAQDRAAAAA
jgi:diguanylate cyclase (GGDEF)-like protein